MPYTILHIVLLAGILMYADAALARGGGPPAGGPPAAAPSASGPSDAGAVADTSAPSTSPGDSPRLGQDPVVAPSAPLMCPGINPTDPRRC
jgi:hypothetical protein